MKLIELKEQVIQLEKGLDRAEALSQALKKVSGDYRGFTYDPKTGKATLI